MGCGGATRGGLGLMDGPICNAEGGSTATLTIKVRLSHGNRAPAGLDAASAENR